MNDDDRILFGLARRGYGGIQDLIKLRDEDIESYFKLIEYNYIEAAIEYKLNKESEQNIES